MTTAVRNVVPELRPLPSLPREHGFWTMLAAVVLVAVARSGLSPAVLLVAAAVVAGAVALGAVSRRSIRRHESLQLASAVGLSLGDAPIELAGGAAPASVAVTVLAWAVVFLSSALCVRASFARASRKRSEQAPWLQGTAVILPCVAAILFVATGAGAHAIAALIAAAGCTALAVKKPDVKQMKAVGLFLAGVTALAAVALGAS
jgi:hypothetical protein